MTLGIVTTITNPVERGDNFKDALDCYSELADEVVVIDGSGQLPDSTEIVMDTGVRYISYCWPQEFSWTKISKQFQRAYEECTSDWCLRLDIDCIINENDFARIREACEKYPDAPALSLYKHQFILPDRYNLKSRLVLLANKKKFGDRLSFDSGGDLCQLSKDGKYLTPDDIPQAEVPVWNYEKLLKSKDQIAEDQGRMERAWFRHFGEYQMGSDGTNENALERWLEAQKGKFNKPQKHIKLEEHPKFIQETIKNLKPEQFGYSGFDELGKNDYVRNSLDQL